MQLDAERQLLEEGSRSYVAAANAIRAFKEIVISRCRQVVENRWKEYVGALGREPEKSRVTPYDTTLDSDWNGKGAALGTSILIGKQTSRICHVLWLNQEEEEGAWVCVCVRLGTLTKFRQFWAGLKPHEPALEEAGREIWLFERLSPDEIGEFQKKLDKVLCRWIQLMNAAGGLRVLFDEPSDSRD
jgi:hypothetical protein